MANGSTDTRIVQMRFDNQNFERNISRSEKSLDRFKEQLNFEDCEKSLSEFEKSTKKLTFDSMAENLQKLTDKFTGLGTVSEYILSQIRHSLEGCAAKAQAFVKSMSIDQINAGMSKFEELSKNVQTIMSATGQSEEEVYTILKRLNEYTDQTSYNFTDMAANIGKFTSVGIPLEQAEKQMEGIANWAARSGGGIQEASRAMYNLSQAMGVGALTKIDWKSIENAGMATKEFKEQLMMAGVEAGTLEVTHDKAGNKIYKTSKKLGKQVEVTYQNLAETLSKKWVNTDTMQKAFLSYYYEDLYYEGISTAIAVTDEQKKIIEDAFSDNSKIDVKEWKSLESQKLATEEIKQAAIDAAVAQGNLVKETTKDGKTIYKTAKKYGKETEVTLESFEQSLSIGWLDRSVGKQVWAFDDLAKASYEAAQKCKTFTDVIGAWKDQISTGWMQSFQHIFGNLSESMELFSNICNKVADSLTNLIEFRNSILENFGKKGGRDSLWSMLIGEVTETDAYGNVTVVAYKNAYGVLDIFMDIGEMLKTGFVNLVKMFATGDDAIAMDKRQDENYLGMWLGAKLKEVVDNVKNFVQSIKDFFNAVPKGGGKSRFQQIQDLVNGLFATAALLYSVIRDIGEFISNIVVTLTPSIDAIIFLMSELGQTFQSVSKDALEGKGLKVVLDGLFEAIQPLLNALNILVITIVAVASTILEVGRNNDGFTNLFTVLGDVIKKVADVISSVGVPIIRFFATVSALLGELFLKGLSPENLANVGTKFKTALENLADNLFSFIPNFSRKVKEFWQSVTTWFRNGFRASDWKAISSKLKSAAKQTLAALPDGFKESAGRVLGQVKTFLSDIWNKIKGIFTDAINVFKSRFSSESITQFKNRLKEIWHNITNALPEGFRTGAKNTIEHIKELITNLWAKLTGHFNTFKEKLSGYAMTFGQSIRESAGNILTRVKTFLVNVWERIKEVFTDAINIFKNRFSSDSIEKFKERLRSIWSSITNALPEGFKNGSKTAFAKIKELITNLWTKLSGLFTKFIDSIFGFIPNFSQRVSDFWNSVTSWFRNGFQLSDWETIVGKLKNAAKYVLDAIPTGFKESVANIFNRIKTFFTNVWERIKSIFNDAVNVFKSRFSAESIAQFRDNLKGIWSSITNAIPEGFKNGSKNAFVRIKELITNLWSKVSGVFTSLIDSLFSSIPNFSQRVGEFWTSVKNWFKNGFKASDWETVSGKLKNGAKAVLDAIPTGFKESVANVFSRIRTFFVNVWEKIKDIFGDVVNVFKNRFSAESVDQLKTRLANIWKKITDAIPEGFKTGAKNVFGRVKELILKLWDKLSGLFKGNGILGKTGSSDGLGKQISNVVSKALGSDENLDIQKLEKESIFTLIINFLKRIGSKFIEGVRRLLENMGQITGTFADSAAGIIEKVKKWNWSAILYAFLGVAGAAGIGVLIAKVLNIIKTLVGGVKNISKAISKLVKDGFTVKIKNGDEKAETFGEKLLKFAGAIAIVTASLVLIANLPANDAWRALAILAIISTLLIAVTLIMKKSYKKAEVNEASAMLMGLLGVSIAIALLVKALLPLAKVDLAGLAKMGGGLVAIVIALKLMAKETKKGGLSAENLGGVLAFCAGIWLLISALLKVKNLTPEQLIKMGVTLIAILGILFVFAKKVKRLDSGFANSGLSRVALLAIAIGILIFSLLPLAIVPWGGLAKMGAGLIVVLGALFGFIKLVNKFAAGGLQETAMAQLIAVASSIVLIMTALLPLAIVPWAGFARMEIGLVSVLGALFGFIVGVNKLAGTGLKGTGMIQLLAVSFSIVMLVTALLPLAIVPWAGFARMEIGLVTILAALFGFIVGVNKLTKQSGLKGTGMAQLIALALAIAGLVVALMPLALVEWNQLAKMCLGLVVVLGMLTLVISRSKKLKPKNALSIALSMLSLAALIVAFGWTLSNLPKDLDWGTIIAFSAGLAVMMVALAAAIKVLGGMSLGSAIKGVLIVAAAVAALLAVVALMAPIVIGRIGGSLQTMSAQLSIISSMFNDFINTMNLVSEGDVESAKAKFNKLFDLIMSLRDVTGYLGAVVAFGECISRLGSTLSQFQFTTQDVKNPEGSSAILLLDKLLTYKDKLAGFTNGESFATEIAYLGAGLNVFDTATSGISQGTNPPALQMLTAVLDLSGRFGELDGAADLSAKLLRLGTGLGVFNVSTKGITNGTDIPALQMLTAVLDLSSRFDELSGAFKVATQLTLFGSGLGIFNTSISGITTGDDIPALKMLTAVLDLSGRFGELNGAFAVSTKLGFLGSALATFNTSISDVTNDDPVALQLLTKIAGMADSLQTLLGLNLDDFSDQMAGLGGALSIYALGVKDAAGLDAGEMPDVSGAIAILESLSQGLADEMGGFAIPELPPESDLKNFGVQLAALAGGLIKFADASQNLGDNTQKALDVLTFMKQLKTDLTADSLEITKVFGTADVHFATLTSFGIDIAALGSSMKTYSEATKDFKYNTAALDTITFFYNLQKRLQHDTMDAALFTMFTGQGLEEKTFAAFGVQIAALGNSMKEYNEVVKDFEGSSKALDAINYFYHLQERLTGTEMKKEIFTMFSGEGIDVTTFEAFGLQIAALGNCMKSYSESVSEFKGNQEALDAITYFGWLQERLLGTEMKKEAFEKIFGLEVDETDMGKFGLQVSALGSSMATYSKSVSRFKNNQDALDAIDFFYDLQERLLASSINSTIFTFFTGTTQENMVQFGNDISTLGDSLAKFASSVNYDEGKAANFDNALKGLDVMIRLTNELPLYGGLNQLIEGSKLTLGSLATNITELGVGLGKLSDALLAAGQKSGKPYDSTVVNQALESVKVIAEIANTFDATMGDESGYLESGYLAVKRYTEILNSMNGKTGLFDPLDFIKNIVSFMKQFEEMSEAKGGFKNLEIFEAFANVAKGVHEAFSASEDLNFKPIGLSMTEGLKLGILEGKAGVVDAMVEVALEAYVAAKQAIDSNSPSKLFMELGGFASSGLALGMQKGKGEVAQASTAVATTALDTTSDILSTLGQLLLGDIDTEPTIRPVLDLTNVREGARSLSGILGGTYGYGATIDPDLARRLASYTAAGEASVVATAAPDYSGLYDKIDAASAKISELGTQIRNMRLYLDTGALVGGLTEGIDSNIGRRSFYEGRNN